MKNPLATIHRLTGRAIRLGVLEEVGKSEITEDRIAVLVNRVKYRETRHGIEVLKRGATVYEFTNTPDGWKMSEPFTQWWSIPDELHVARPGLSPEEHAARVEWETLCYRPGTPNFPMDNAERRAQGIK
jgi:hypothetical protein